jgi:hypothetical protein
MARTISTRAQISHLQIIDDRTLQVEARPLDQGAALVDTFPVKVTGITAATFVQQLRMFYPGHVRAADLSVPCSLGYEEPGATASPYAPRRAQYLRVIAPRP